MSKTEKQPKVSINWRKLIPILSGLIIGFVVIFIFIGRVAK
jgi:hypothetical protein